MGIILGDEIEVPSSVELESNEEAVLLVRQHWFVFRDPVLLALFVPFVLFFFIFLIDELGNGATWLLWIQDALIFLSAISFVIGVVWFFWKLYLWRKTFYLVTNLRIILLTRYSLFKHDDRETALQMIQDVKAEVNGMQPALYGFGDVTVQVSSQDARLILEKVPKPREVQRVIVREAHLKTDKPEEDTQPTLAKNTW